MQEYLETDPGSKDPEAASLPAPEHEVLRRLTRQTWLQVAVLKQRLFELQLEYSHSVPGLREHSTQLIQLAVEAELSLVSLLEELEGEPDQSRSAPVLA